MAASTAFETAASVKAGKGGARKAVECALGKIKKGANLGAFLEVFEQEALQRADAIDQKAAKGCKLGRLAGVPVALKDNLLYDGHAMTCGSKILQGYKAVYNATVVEKLLAEDAVLVGRTNMDEFAMGSSCENSAYQPTRNPADPERVPGGSSGGSAAAVAAEMSAIALGSDTGGSIRQPASLCGVVGLKPTYGLVSRYGLVAFASSLDQVGPFTADVRDSALALSVLSGHDRRDSTSADRPAPDYLAGIDDGVKGLKIGIPKEYFGSGLDPEVEKLVRGAAAALEKSGAILREISLPYMKYAVAAYYIVASSEASSNLARFDGVRYGQSAAKDNPALSLQKAYEKTRGHGFGPEVKRRIMLGTYALSAGYYDAYYAKAQKIRALIRNDFTRAFEGCDLVLTPTSPTPAFKLGEKMSDPLQMYLSDVYTIPCNMAGIPGISIPCGRTAAGLPVGFQLFGPSFSEPVMFRAGRAYERSTKSA